MNLKRRAPLDLWPAHCLTLYTPGVPVTAIATAGGFGTHTCVIVIGGGVKCWCFARDNMPVDVDLGPGLPIFGSSWGEWVHLTILCAL